jgi:hypothetical protein
LRSLESLNESLPLLEAPAAALKLVSDAVDDGRSYAEISKAVPSLGHARDIGALLDVYVFGREVFDFELYCAHVWSLGRNKDIIAGEFKEDKRVGLYRKDLELQIELIKDRRDPPKGATPKRLLNFAEGCFNLGVDSSDVLYWINSRARWFAANAGEEDKARAVALAEGKGLVVTRLKDGIAGKLGQNDEAAAEAGAGGGGGSTNKKAA